MPPHLPLHLRDNFLSSVVKMGILTISAERSGARNTLQDYNLPTSLLNTRLPLRLPRLRKCPSFPSCTHYAHSAVRNFPPLKFNSPARMANQ